MSKVLKDRMTDELETFFKGRDAVLFVGYGKVASGEAVMLRRELRKDKVALKLVKNNLAIRALERLDLRGVDPYFQGATAAAVGGEDPVALAKAVAAVAKKIKGIEIKGGLVEGRAVGKTDIDRLTNLPSREVLISRVMACFQAPVAGVAKAVNDLNGRLARVLAAVRDARNEPGEA